MNVFKIIIIITILIETTKSTVYITTCNNRWGQECIPVIIDSSLITRKEEIITAMDIIIENTNAGLILIDDYKEINSEKPEYCIRVRAGGGCSSYIGKVATINDCQIISLASGCPLYSIVHEFMHAIGIYHEQSRTDRDTYVKINFENIQSGRENNFQIATGSQITPGSPYDFGSVMHYSAFAFSKNGQPTIVPLVSGVTIGQRTTVSDLDFQTINYALLKCDQIEPRESTCELLCNPICRNGGQCVRNTQTNKNECDCTGTGYIGKTCREMTECNPECEQGICVNTADDILTIEQHGENPETNLQLDSRCECFEGYTGPTCNIPICILECLNGSECIRPNECKCRQGFSGTRCEKTNCGELK